MRFYVRPCAFLLVWVFVATALRLSSQAGDATQTAKLEDLLKQNGYAANVYRFTAAEDLFSLGTPEAHAVLSAHLLTNYVPISGCTDAAVQHALMQMREPGRSGFINQYLLNSLSRNLQLELDYQAHPPTGLRGTVPLDLGITFRNTSSKAFRIPKLDQLSLGDLLYCRSTNGLFLPREHNGTGGERDLDGSVELGPEGSHRFQLRTHLEFYEAQSNSLCAVMETFRTRHFVPTGPFEVVAMFECAPARSLGPVEKVVPWSGRAVSKPILVRYRVPTRKSP